MLLITVACPKQQMSVLNSKPTFLGCFQTKLDKKFVCAMIFPKHIITLNLINIGWETAEKSEFAVYGGHLPFRTGKSNAFKFLILCMNAIMRFLLNAPICD